ncbi:MAG: TRAP transporter large permease [Alphaproteobacteria bacterium]
MSTIAIGLLGVIVMLVLMALRMHIGFTMAVVGFVGIYIITGDWYIAFHSLGTVPYSSVATFLLIAVPLFTLMGRFAYHSGISADLYATASTWMRHLPGGLAVATVGACAMFSAVSGSSLAAAASMGAIAVPEMLRHKIDPRLATGVVAAGGTLGIMIPPSLGFIIYGLIAEESIGTLLIAGILPGIILAGSFMVVAMIWATLSPAMATRQAAATWGERFRSLGGVWGILVLFGLVMGGIYGGFMTPTEAAAIGAAGSLLLLVLRKGWSLPEISESLRETTAITAMIFMILIGAHVFNVFLALSRLPTSITDFVIALEISPIMILLVIFAGYVVLGCFLDTLAMIVLTVPILLPAIQAMGYDPIWFGVMIVMVMEMGLITPPVGMIVYVIKGVVPAVELRDIFVGVWPFVAAQVAILMLFLFWPDITLWLPGLMRD